MRKKRVDSRTAGYIAMGVFGFVLMVACAFMLLSKHSQASKLGKQITATQGEIATIDAAQASSQNANAIQVVDIYRLKKAMPDQVDMPDIMFELSRVAALSHIQFQGIQPGVPVIQSNYEVLPVNVTFQGTYSQLSGFLSRLRGLVTVHHGFLGATGRLYTVDNIGFIEGKPHFPQILATLTVDAYIYGSSGAPAPGAAAAAVAAQNAGTSGTTTTPPTTTSSSSAEQTPPTSSPASPAAPVAPAAPSSSASALGARP